MSRLPSEVAQQIADLQSDNEVLRSLYEIQDVRIESLIKEVEAWRAHAGIAPDHRLVTLHICATAMGVSATYPEGSNAGEVAHLLWEYIQRSGSDAISQPYEPVLTKPALDLVKAVRRLREEGRIEWSGLRPMNAEDPRFEDFMDAVEAIAPMPKEKS